FFRALTNQIDNIRQMQQISFINLNNLQSVFGKRGPDCLHQSRFARTARTGQQHIISTFALDKLAGVANNRIFLCLNIFQCIQFYIMWMLDRLKITHPFRAYSPTKRVGRPIRLGWQERQYSFYTGNKLLKAGNKLIVIWHVTIPEVMKSYNIL